MKKPTGKMGNGHGKEQTNTGNPFFLAGENYL